LPPVYHSRYSFSISQTNSHSVVVVVLTTAQPLPRWPCNVAQVKFSLSSGYLSFSHAFSVISETITINTVKKRIVLGYIFVTDSTGLTSNTFM